VHSRGLVLAGYRGLVRLVAGRGLDRLPLLRAINGRLLRYLERAPARVGRHRLVVDPGDTLRLYSKGVYEPFETSLFEQEVRSGDVVLDLGANIGYYTLIFASRVGPAGHVYAFEPDPENAELLRRNVELNGYRNVTAVEAAVSDEQQTLTLYLSDESKAHRIYDAGGGRGTATVEAVRLDDWFAQHGETARIDIVKMDIEGAEGLAFAGMRGLVARTRPRLLVTEFQPRSLARCGTEPAAYLAALRAAGYALYEIPRDATGMKVVEDRDLLDRYPVDSERFANLACRPVEVSSTSTRG
jgi:FkbM family methyltransferase